MRIPKHLRRHIDTPEESFPNGFHALWVHTGEKEVPLAVGDPKDPEVQFIALFPTYKDAEAMAREKLTEDQWARACVRRYRIELLTQFAKMAADNGFRLARVSDGHVRGFDVLQPLGGS